MGDIYKFFITDPKNMSGVGRFFWRTVKSHLDFYRELKSNLPPEEIYPEGSYSSGVGQFRSFR